MSDLNLITAPIADDFNMLKSRMKPIRSIDLVKKTPHKRFSVYLRLPTGQPPNPYHYSNRRAGGSR
jgi:hypothetical protein